MTPTTIPTPNLTLYSPRFTCHPTMPDCIFTGYRYNLMTGEPSSCAGSEWIVEARWGQTYTLVVTCDAHLLLHATCTCAHGQYTTRKYHDCRCEHTEQMLDFLTSLAR